MKRAVTVVVFCLVLFTIAGLWTVGVRCSHTQLCVNHMRNLYTAAVSYCLEHRLGPNVRITVSELRGYVSSEVTVCPDGDAAYPAFTVLDGPSCPNGHRFMPERARPLRASDPKTAGLYLEFGLTNLIDIVAEPVVESGDVTGQRGRKQE